MIEERGRVLSTEPGAVWVATIRSSTCGSCQAKAGCGQALLQKLGSGSSQGFVRQDEEQGNCEYLRLLGILQKDPNINEQSGI